MHTLKIKHPFAAKMKKGYPLIEKEAVSSQENGIKEGSLIRITDENGRFLGKGYYGEQNKGIGWILNFVSIGLVRLFSRGSIEISVNTVQEAMAILPGFFGGIIVYLLVWNVLMWLLTWIILKKKLNIL